MGLLIAVVVTSGAQDRDGAVALTRKARRRASGRPDSCGIWTSTRPVTGPRHLAAFARQAT